MELINALCVALGALTAAVAGLFRMLIKEKDKHAKFL